MPNITRLASPSSHSGSGFHWIPYSNQPEWTIYIEDEDGTFTEQTDKVLSANFTLGATDQIGNFTVTLENITEEFTNKYEYHEWLNL